jgi:hypothetical protein
MPPVTTAIRFVILSILDINVCESREFPMAVLHLLPPALPQCVAASGATEGNGLGFAQIARVFVDF